MPELYFETAAEEAYLDLNFDMHPGACRDAANDHGDEDAEAAELFFGEAA